MDEIETRKNEVIAAANALCGKFVDKVESGLARSRETYTECKALLEMIRNIGKIQYWDKKICSMSQIEMARLWRFSSGHPCFDSTLPLFKRFEKRFQELGGMTPAISKAIGWEEKDDS